MSKKFADLTKDQKIRVIDMYREAVDVGVKSLILQKAYADFVQCRTRGTPMDPVKMWDSLPEATREHFDHTIEIEACLDSLESELGDHKFLRDSVTKEPVSKTVPTNAFFDHTEQGD